MKEEVTFETVLTAFEAGQVAFEEFEGTPHANFPTIPYGNDNLREEWLLGFQHLMTDSTDIGVCSECGSKDIWYLESQTWCDVNTHEVDKHYPNCANTRCRNCCYSDQAGWFITDIWDYVEYLIEEIENS